MLTQSFTIDDDIAQTGLTVLNLGCDTALGNSGELTSQHLRWNCMGGHVYIFLTCSYIFLTCS